jgi:predicted Fe-Mo cluster-binding NifX family protein
LAIRTTEGRTVTIHLGPAVEVEALTKDLSRGMAIKAEVFRTEATPDGQYVARTLTFGDRTVVLRDRSLRPVWARQGPSSKPPLKIAVTAAGATLDSAVDPQFGRCPYFVVIDLKTGSFEALKNTYTQGRQAGVQSARMIASKGAKVLLTGKCGPSALRALSAERIEVVSGCSGTVREVLEQYKAGKLATANEGNARSSPPSQDTRPP